MDNCSAAMKAVCWGCESARHSEHQMADSTVVRTVAQKALSMAAPKEQTTDNWRDQLTADRMGHQKESQME